MLAALLVFIAFALVAGILSPRTRHEADWLLWRQNQEGRGEDD
ncbi:MAG: hypothetical protein U1A07_06820 [Phenylobacterium sp.]|jgi:hypothetical protein|nr:hypothetical protein [Phenylobacterium sp.]MDZ4318541.1 hypothetical protein [Phenylobacterium sp.]